MYCNRLHAWRSTQSRLTTLLSSLIARRWVGLQNLWRFRLEDLFIDELVGTWCFGYLSGPPGFTCWMFLLWCSVLFTVESLSLLCFIFISRFMCSRRWCIDKLGVFHANQISMCLDPHLNSGWGLHCETGLGPPVKYFTDCSKVVLLLWIFYVSTVLCLLFLCACLFICALWSPAGKGLTSWLSFVMYNCEFWHFSIGILGQVWCLIVSIPDLCPLSYFITWRRVWEWYNAMQ